MAESSPLAHSPTLKSGPAEDGGGDLAAGTPVGEYVVDHFLGAGAMGAVYAGRHPVIGKKVAIKILQRDVAASVDGAERFTREARAVNQIDHPNVIDIFGFGRLADGRLYLVMDLVEGKSLRRALVDGPLDVAAALDVLGQIADALDAAHARGVVHRDLKPDNVMLGDGTPPKVFVLDFGLAKLLSTGDASPKASMLTGKGTWLGTPGYMAPEQWSADGAGPASDRYSFGVLAFELLSGSLPFQAASLPQMMEQHFRAKVPALSARGAVAANTTFDPVMSRAMAKDPEERFASAREMVDALRAAAGDKLRVASPSKRPWIPAVAGASVLGLAIAAFVIVTRDRPSADRAEGRAPAPSAAPVAGKVRLELLSVPEGAEVRRDGALVGSTPTRLDVDAESQLVLELTKPGYGKLRYPVRVGTTDPSLPVLRLDEIRGFEGVWVLPGGELRAFARGEGKVTVSKLEAVDGARRFYRTFELVAAEQGVAFENTEDVVDPRAPNEPSCHIPHKVTYHYDPAGDALEVHRQRFAVDFVNGACVIKTADMAPVLALKRADRRSSDARETLPPVGKPVVLDEKQDAKEVTNDAVVNDSLDNTLDGGKDAGLQKVPASKTVNTRLKAIDRKAQDEEVQQRLLKGKKQPPTKLSTKPTPFESKPPAPQVQQKSAPPQQNSAPPPQQPSNLPAQLDAPRGDSQVAPQVEPQQVRKN